MREDVAANAAILRRLAEIDKTLLVHNVTLREILQKLRPLLEPSPQPPKPDIGFHVKEDAVPYRCQQALVALGWLLGTYRLRTKWLWDGSDVAWRWLERPFLLSRLEVECWIFISNTENGSLHPLATPVTLWYQPGSTLAQSNFAPKPLSDAKT